MLRSFARACTQMAGWTIALSVSSCSVLLDWNGYTGGEDPGDDATDEDATTDANAAHDARFDADANASDGTEATDAADRSDARDAPADLLEAAPPACSPSNCGGCCNSNGFCAGGGSEATCGTGGEACRNCAALGESCDQGECSSVDSGPPPTCDPMQCQMKTLCIPVWQGACCLADGTCGCRIVLPPPMGKCM